ncbi:mCG147093, partial [Mus musculus]
MLHSTLHTLLRYDGRLTLSLPYHHVSSSASLHRAHTAVFCLSHLPITYDHHSGLFPKEMNFCFV